MDGPPDRGGKAKEQCAHEEKLGASGNPAKNGVEIDEAFLRYFNNRHNAELKSQVEEKSSVSVVLVSKDGRAG